MTHIFTLQEDEERGINGWRLDRKPYFDVMDGRGVAHDVIEEAPHGGEQPHDELIALGCFLWARGANTWGREAPYKGVVADMCEILRHIADESGYFMHPAPKTRPLSELDYDDLESQIQYIAREYCEKLTEWVGNEFGPWGDEKAQADMIEEYRSYRSHVISWLRLGVRRARSRYRQIDSYSVSYMFEQISKEVDKLTKRADLNDKLYITVNIKRCFFTATLKPYVDPYARYW